MKVGILHETVIMGDAVGHDVLGMYHFFQMRGDEVVIICTNARDSLKTRYHIVTDCAVQEATLSTLDIVIYHHSVFWARGQTLIQNTPDARLIFKYHNVTPSSFFEPYFDLLTQLCAQGRKQTQDLIHAHPRSHWLSASYYNGEELLTLGLPCAQMSVVPPFHRVFLQKRLEIPQCGGQTTALFVGRFAPNKGHKHLVRALSAYHLKYGAHLKLVIIGKQDVHLKQYYNEVLVLIDELHLQSAVEIRNHVSEAELLNAFNEAHVYLCLSEHEGFCVPVVEAQAQGLPVVVADYAALLETLGANQLSVPALQDSSDYQALADLLYAITHNPVLTQQLVASGYQNFNNRFSQEKISAALAKALDILGFTCVAPSKPVPPRILLDVSYITSIDHATGIQRVVRNIAKNLPNAMPHHDVILVKLVNGCLHHAEEMSAKLFGTHPHTGLLPIQQGDQMVMLDSSWEPRFSFGGVFHEIRQKQGTIITVVYDTIPVDYAEFCDSNMRVIFRNWLQSSVAASDLMLCISQDVAQHVQSLIKREQWEASQLTLSYFHLGSEVQEQEAAATPTHHYTTADSPLPPFAKTPLFVSISTIEPRKGQRTLLKAFEQLWSRGVAAQLCLVGKKGWHMDDFILEIESHAELNKQLFWLQNCSDTQLEAIYQQASCLLFASAAEGFGLGIVEAARHGVPSICSDIGVFHEIADGGAVFVEKDNVDAWAQAIEHFEDNKRKLDVRQIKTISWQESARQFAEAILGTQQFVAHLPGDVEKAAAIRLLHAAERTHYHGMRRDTLNEHTYTNEIYTTKIYEVLLQRAPDQEGYQRLIFRLENREITRQSMVIELINSAEFGALSNHYRTQDPLFWENYVEDAYQVIFQRKVDEQAKKHFVALLTTQKADAKSLVNNWLSSDEFIKIVH